MVEATLEAYGRPVEDKSLFALAVVKRSSLTKRRSSFALLISKDKEVKVLAPTDQPLAMANLFFRDDLVYIPTYKSWLHVCSHQCALQIETRQT